MNELRIPLSFDPASIRGWLAEWGRVSEEKELRIVLPSVASLAPAGVSLLAASIASRTEAGNLTRFRAENENDEGFRYLGHIGFFDVLGIDPEGSFPRGAPEGHFVRLARIETTTVARGLADRHGRLLEAALPTAAPSVLRAARFVMEELGANIVQHSGRPATGFGLAQAYPQVERGRFQVAFCDAGMGFLASLQRNPEWLGRVEDHSEALQFAFEQRASGGIPKENLGLGLALLRDLSDRLGADLWAISGDCLYQRRSGPNRARLQSVRPVTPFRGAWICLDAPSTAGE